MHVIARSNLALAALAVALAPLAAHADGTHPLAGTLEGMAKASPAPPAVFAPGVYPGAAKPGGAFDGYATVAYALTHAPTLLAQRATVLNLDSQYTKARAAEYPTATGELQNQIQKQGNSSGQFAQFGITPTSNFSQNTAELSSTYNLFNGTAQIAAQQAKRQVDNAKFELERQEEQTAIAVSNAFYALAANRENVVVDEGDLAYQRDLLATAVAEEHVGRVAGVDVLRAQVAVERSESTLVQARTDEANARETLAVQIGAPAETQFAVPDVLPEPPLPATPLDVLGTIAKMNRPEISEARAALAASKLGDAAVDSTCARRSRLTVLSAVKSRPRTSSTSNSKSMRAMPRRSRAIAPNKRCFRASRSRRRRCFRPSTATSRVFGNSTSFRHSAFRCTTTVNARRAITPRARKSNRRWRRSTTRTIRCRPTSTRRSGTSWRQPKNFGSRN